MHSSLRLFVRAFSALVLVTFLPVAHAALEVEAEINPNPVRPNERIRVEFTVVNSGGSTEDNVALQATIPTEFNLFNDDANNNPSVLGNGACDNTQCSAGEVITWTLGSLVAGEATTVSFWTTVKSATADATVISVNAAVFDEDENEDDSVSATATVDSTQQLALTVEDDADPAAPGDTLVYTLTYGNHSGVSVTGNTLSLPLPAGVNFVSATDGGSESSGTVSWNLGTLTAGETGEVQVEVTISGGASAGDLLIVDSATLIGLGDQANAQAITQVAGSTPLRLAAQANPAPARENERLRAEFTVSNTSDSAMTNVTLEGRIPDELDLFNDGANVNPSVLGVGACDNTQCSKGEIITWSLGTLAAGEATTVAYWTDVAATAGGGELIIIDARVTADGGHEAVAAQAAAVSETQQLALSVEDDKDPAAPGDALVYTLTYGNHGGSSVLNNTLSLPLPAGVRFISATDGGTESGGTVTWNLGTLVAGEIGQVQAQVNVRNSTDAGDLLTVDHATLTGTNHQAIARAITQVVDNPALLLAIEANPAPVRDSERLRSEFTVSNTSDAAMTNVTLEGRIPDELDLFNDGANVNPSVLGVGACGNTQCSAGEIITWNLGTLAAGEATTVAYWSQVSSSSGEIIVLDARVTADSGFEALSAAGVAVNDIQQLALELEDDADPVAPGTPLVSSPLVYTLTYGNHGESSVLSNTLSLPLPAGVIFLSATDGGTENGGIVTWNLNTLTAGASGQVQVKVKVRNTTAAGELLIIDNATLTGNGHEAIAQTVTQIADSPSLLLAIEANPARVRSNELLRSEFTVSNSSGSPMTNVIVEGRIPNRLDLFNDGANANPSVLGVGACGNTQCSASEIITWNLGTLAAGEAVTVAYWSDIANNTDSGELMVLDARATADAAKEAVAARTVAVDNSSALSLSIDENLDVVANGGTLEYTLVFGNRSLATVQNVTLALPVPAGTSFADSFGSPSVFNNTVLWNLGTLLAGDGGMVKASFLVTGASGTPINAQALLEGDTAEIRADAVTRVRGSSPLSVVVDVLAPNQPDDNVTVEFDVTNTTGGSLSDVTLQSRIPDEFDLFNDGLSGVPAVVGGGACDNTQCSAGEIITWNLGTLTAGESVTVSYSTDVASGLASGVLIAVDAYATEVAGSQTTDTETVLIGPDSDGDQDGMPDTYEFNNGLDRNDPADAQGDLEPDGLSNVDEFLFGTGVNIADSDTDTILDGPDNCKLISNQNQNDNDEDSLGDVCDSDDDNDGILDVNDNCQFVINNDQADGDLDGVGNACEPKPVADVTEAGDTGGDGDVAVLLQGVATGTKVSILEVSSGAVRKSIDFFNWSYEAKAIDTISDANANGTANDPAIAVLGLRPINGRIVVQFKKVSNSTALRSGIVFFDEDWAPIDVAIVNDLNGDGTTGDIGVAVLAVNSVTGRNEVELRRLSDGTVVSITGGGVFKRRYFSSNWTVKSVEAVTAPGGGDALISVMATNINTGKTILETRQVSDGSYRADIFAFGANNDTTDLGILADTDGNGTADDPSAVFYGTKLLNGKGAVRVRRMDTGALVKNLELISSSFAMERFTTTPDADGNNLDELGGSARSNANDSLIFKTKDNDTEGTVSTIFPEG